MKLEINCLLIYLMLLIPFSLGLWCGIDNMWYGIGGFTGGQLFSYLRDKREQLRSKPCN